MSVDLADTWEIGVDEEVYVPSKDRGDQWIQSKLIGEISSGNPEALMKKEYRHTLRDTVGSVPEHHNKVSRNLFAGRGSSFSL